MKKVFALMAVAAFAVAVVACGGKKAEEAAAVVDSVATEAVEVVDSAAAVVDSAAAVVDSAAAAQ
jgi:predicted small lipoprotein YifL